MKKGMIIALAVLLLVLVAGAAWAQNTQPAVIPVSSVQAIVRDSTGMAVGHVDITLQGSYHAAVPDTLIRLEPTLAVQIAQIAYSHEPLVARAVMGLTSQRGGIAVRTLTPGTHYAHVQLAITHNGTVPRAASTDTFHVQGHTADGLTFAPVTAVSLPCQAINPHTTQACLVSFVIPETAALTAVSVVYPQTIHIPAP